MTNTNAPKTSASVSTIRVDRDRENPRTIRMAVMLSVEEAATIDRARTLAGEKRGDKRASRALFVREVAVGAARLFLEVEGRDDGTAESLDAATTFVLASREERAAMAAAAGYTLTFGDDGPSLVPSLDPLDPRSLTKDDERDERAAAIARVRLGVEVNDAFEVDGVRYLATPDGWCLAPVLDAPSVAPSLGLADPGAAADEADDEVRRHSEPTSATSVASAFIPAQVDPSQLSFPFAVHDRVVLTLAPSQRGEVTLVNDDGVVVRLDRDGSSVAFPRANIEAGQLKREAAK